MKRELLQWRDVTSWRRSDDEETRKTPRSWELYIGTLQLYVTRHLHLAPDRWRIECSQLNVQDATEPGASDKIAKAMLIQLVKAKLDAIAEEMKYLPQ